MTNNKSAIFFVLIFCVGLMASVVNSGCAQIGMPGGGPKDTLAPVLVKANPTENQLNFSGNRITLYFNEYIDIKDIQTNLLVSPLPQKNPTVSGNLKSVTIKLRDSLLPNTTYSLDFGNAIVDINESNPLKNFTYTFSTGNSIDSLTVSGRVEMAETGKADSTLTVLLYRDVPDSAVATRKPNYMTKLKGDGSFNFTHLPPGNFKVYALKDGDGGKFYNSKTETFAFLNNDIALPGNNAPVLYAYAEEKASSNSITTTTNTTTGGKTGEKKLRYNLNLVAARQDLLSALELTFNYPIKSFDASLFYVADTNYNAIKGVNVTVDSTRKKITIDHTWQPESSLLLLMPKEAIEDSLGNQLAKSDTIRFTTKSNADYGRVVLRFKSLDQTLHPLVQFVIQDNVKYSYPVTGNEWTNTRFPPGDYELRIVYDENKNGKWDPGNYKEKKQPEKSIAIKQRLSIRADWDNERDVEL